MFYRLVNNGNDYVGGITAEDVSYEHVQTDASDEWIVIHNLGKYPSVSIRDADGYETHAGIQYTSKNSLIILFANAETGIAVCN